MFYRLYKSVDNHYYILVDFKKLKLAQKSSKKNWYLQICEIFWCSIKNILMKYEMKKNVYALPE